MLIFLDENQDSVISWSEFLNFQVKSQTMMNASWQIFLDISKIRNDFSEMDADGNGSISKKEFYKAVSLVMVADPE